MTTIHCRPRDQIPIVPLSVYPNCCVQLHNAPSYCCKIIHGISDVKNYPCLSIFELPVSTVISIFSCTFWTPSLSEYNNFLLQGMRDRLLPCPSRIVLCHFTCSSCHQISSHARKLVHNKLHTVTHPLFRRTTSLRADTKTLCPN